MVSRLKQPGNGFLGGDRGFLGGDRGFFSKQIGLGLFFCRRISFLCICLSLSISVYLCIYIYIKRVCVREGGGYIICIYSCYTYNCYTYIYNMPTTLRLNDSTTRSGLV